ncbi:hypothetical protein JTE90_022795 [Oedothorax gibbosus]|uniref:non-specific protein-tyrosine kinase n=1 Tax=Oedothorax gibbosus TaxID=931172 RepID=A0AAV6U875_9ARAC|nr:hypothetical protein JTE90_022795 [Oedothorax gibbosus]
MAGAVTVEFYSGKESLTFNGEDSLVAEDLIIESCKYLKIGPVARPLFSLWNPSDSLWFPLNKEFEIKNGQQWYLHLRLRFKAPSVKDLIEKTNVHLLNYYFHQARNDFLEGRITELCQGQLRESALGLVATDIIRVMLEKQETPETMKLNSRNFIPPVLKKNPLWDNFLCDPLQKAVSRGWKNCRQNPEFVKEKYLQQLTELVPDYGAELHSVLIDESGKVYEVDLVVNPYHPTYPGIRIRVKKSKDNWTRICSIEELCYVSMRSDETVEISRQNGVPQYVQFSGKARMHSFVSLLDGYYRLSEKWIFNLCKDLPTPSLQILRTMKCHGPVGAEFAHLKLEEKADKTDGIYILRESETTYDHYYVDVWTNTKQNSQNISVYKITKNSNNMFAMKGWEGSFPSIAELLSHHATVNKLNFQRCIPPSEYDKTKLLLCRQDNTDNSSLKTRGECSCSAQCIPHDAIVFSHSKSKLSGKFTVVAQGNLRRSCTDSRAVAVKMLRKDTKVSHLQEFLTQCDKILYWQHDAIVSTIGMILTNPTSLVMEWLPIGTLDKYLQSQQASLKEVDLVEAAYHIARALWYLEEQHVCHGNIRCHNILIASHTESSFKVKLADPGLISYTDADIHWIPPEHHSDYSGASRSNLADVYAYGTTLWEILSYGSKPMADVPSKEVKDWYLRHNTLPFPPNCRKEMENLIEECWNIDQDSRKRPQAIVRDVNQILYEVYNSRRSHSYAVIEPTAVIEPELSPSKPTVPSRRPPVKDPPLSKFKNVFKWPVTGPFKGFAYNYLNQSRSMTNASSANSGSSFLTAETEQSIVLETSDSLISISENGDAAEYINSSDLSWVIEKEQLTLRGKIGEGFYGEVSKATLTDRFGFVPEEVAVKRIKMNNQSPICVNELKREMEIMKKLSHKNIVQIRGLVEEPETMLVMEYVNNGSLLNYLQSFKNQKDKLGYSDLFRFALGIAEGMAYLETQNIVHRDLAARNILVGSANSVKISDFGLAQVIKDHYYRMKTERNLPVRWYAIEAIIAQKFSHKSDVWSYGITLWEIFSYGENPQIPDVPDIALHEALQRGQRLAKPPDCPGVVYTLMRMCWELQSQNRPDFGKIIELLRQYDYECT